MMLDVREKIKWFKLLNKTHWSALQDCDNDLLMIFSSPFAEFYKNFNDSSLITFLEENDVRTFLS